MKIRSRLTLQFSLLVGTILMLFAYSVFYFSSIYRLEEFNSRLYEKAKNTVYLLADIDEVTPEILKIIGNNTITLPEEQVIIFDNHLNKIYVSKELPKVIFSPTLISDVKKHGLIYYKIGNRDGIGLLFKGKRSNYVVFAIAYDKYGFSKLKNLRIVLAFGLLISSLITMLIGWIFSGRAINPISKVIEQVDEIKGNNLNKRVNEGNKTDEIAQLAITFNNMLDRVESAFELQKSFVSNASHELRTPLTSITGQIEVTLMKGRSNEEYINSLNSVLDDIKSLTKLTNGLLDLAKTDLDKNKINFKPVRIDELLWSIQMDVSRLHKEYNIDLLFNNYPENESQLSVFGSENLLRSSLGNIVENACKFSKNKSCKIEFSTHNKFILIKVSDNGIGISVEDLTKIFEPFYRGNNARVYSGHGIGLSLSQKILLLHNGEMRIDSKLNQFTHVYVSLPFLNT
jgi:signal transduction histidine kinase